jgi:Fe-S-cluster-containing dehydrogenase component
MSYLWVDNGKCVGCKTCEVACSYHHEKIFSPRIASLEIRREVNEVGVSILFFEHMTTEERVARFPCDHCKGEALPLCVKYCPVQAITVQEAGCADERKTFLLRRGNPAG